MNLPKFDMPTFKADIVSKKTQLEMRPMTIKEQKILLMAKTSESASDILKAIHQIISNCVVRTSTDIDDMTMYDLTSILIKLRSQSVSNKIALEYDNGGRYVIDLDQIDAPKTTKRSNEISINESTSLVLRDVPVYAYMTKEYDDIMSEEVFNQGKYMGLMMLFSVVTLKQESGNIDLSAMDKNELNEWINSLPAPVYEKIENYLNSAPSFKHSGSYKDSEGEEHKIELSSLYDFFLI